MSAARGPGAKKGYVTQFIENLEEGIKYPVEEVQKEAVKALSELTKNYYPKPSEVLQNRLIRKFIQHVLFRALSHDYVELFPESKTYLPVVAIS